ncbi:zinc-binding alcohol dehydrogenase [Ancylobacter sonchi]|uniref:zinc-dependent alcohol dehydrogenase n=1 Tax=Ancylobacter sonchi TaxID=1937790 RepID=UPI001BD4BAE2|nr:zinc-binding alcohol dehydrogenase [Ancylobacter sonchi]MBS7533411.1 zinc-binding alcohol dehydrogenase [Ancylobacter sonchi]
MSNQPQESTRQLWCVAPKCYELRHAPLGKRHADMLAVRAIASCISRGTERLVLNGSVPVSEHQRMRAPLQKGEFPFPVQYGYQSVGIVEAGPDEWLGRAVFALHPHQDRYLLPISSALPVPDGVPPERATLAANMETALNAMWDAGAGPGDRITIVGGGVVGLLLTALAAALPGADVTLVDVRPDRAELAKSFGAAFARPGAVGDDADLVFHASASAAGLKTALAAGGFEAKIVEVSWYGDQAPPVPLGESFHSRRLQLIGSQVGSVSPLRRPRWSSARRLAKALALLDDARFDQLVTHVVPFAQAPARLPQLLAEGEDALAILLDYR